MMDKELLQRYVEGNVSDEEIETVVAWLDADEANVREFMALHKLYDISVLNRPVTRPTTARKTNFSLVRKWTVKLAEIAAVFLLACLVLRFVQTHQTEKETPLTWQTFYAPAGQRAGLTLADGSHIWLNAQTKISYPSRFEEGNRIVRLEGEAYFIVQSDKQHPFLVKTNQTDVRVSGTEFNVIAYPNDSLFEISLLEGSVELLSNGQPAYRMKVNETVKWENGRFVAMPIRDFDYFRWQEGLICFHNETVENILKKLERYFDVRINVKKTNLLNRCYSGKFRASDGIEQVLRVLQLEHKFSYERDNEQNVITIK